jgi:hypothetical protein
MKFATMKNIMSMIFGFMIGFSSFALAEVAYFRTDCDDLKECGKKHAQEMDDLIKKIGYPRSHSTVFVNSNINSNEHFMTTMIYG